MTERPKKDGAEPSKDEPREEPQGPPKTISSSQLFGEDREVHIEHEGEVYRLRITRRGKLILQK